MTNILDIRRVRSYGYALSLKLIIQDLSRQVEAIRQGEDESYKKTSSRTIFHELLDSKLPPEELKRDRLRDEAFSLVTAGSGTT